MKIKAKAKEWQRLANWIDVVKIPKRIYGHKNYFKKMPHKLYTTIYPDQSSNTVTFVYEGEGTDEVYSAMFTMEKCQFSDVGEEYYFLPNEISKIKFVAGGDNGEEEVTISYENDWYISFQKRSNLNAAIQTCNTENFKPTPKLLRLDAETQTVKVTVKNLLNVFKNLKPYMTGNTFGMPVGLYFQFTPDANLVTALNSSIAAVYNGNHENGGYIFTAEEGQSIEGFIFQDEVITVINMLESVKKATDNFVTIRFDVSRMAKASKPRICDNGATIDVLIGEVQFEIPTAGILSSKLYGYRYNYSDLLQTNLKALDNKDLRAATFDVSVLHLTSILAGIRAQKVDYNWTEATLYMSINPNAEEVRVGMEDFKTTFKDCRETYCDLEIRNTTQVGDGQLAVVHNHKELLLATQTIKNFVSKPFMTYYRITVREDVANIVKCACSDLITICIMPVVSHNYDWINRIHQNKMNYK
jgi:hypothetical protein